MSSQEHSASLRRWAMGAAAMAATIAVGATGASRPAAASAESAGPPHQAPHPAVVKVAPAEADADTTPSLHGIPPEVFAARIESLSAILTSR
jgi:hypothetical protein